MCDMEAAGNDLYLMLKGRRGVKVSGRAEWVPMAVL